MEELVLKIVGSADGKWRAQIVRRTDGYFSYRVLNKGDAAGPDIGIFDTAETAEIEAHSKMRQRMI